MWAKWVMKVPAEVYIVGGVVSLFLPGPLKHCYASSGGFYLARRMPSEVLTRRSCTRRLAPASPSVTVRLCNQPGDDLDLPCVSRSVDHHHVRRDVTHAGYRVLLGPTILYSFLGELRRECRVQAAVG